MMAPDIWYIPIGADRVLVYAPFHGITTLVNHAMAGVVSACLKDETKPLPPDAAWVSELRRPGNRPDRHYGRPDPLFFGLVPTRGCMMRCAYCDFDARQKHPPMSFDMIRRAADGYAEMLRDMPDAEWNMHFFGGEPFAAFKEVVFALNYARRKAGELQLPVHFEVTTNGFFPEEKARWIAENFDTVVLSLDGFPAVQDRHRPGLNGAASFPVVSRSADIFSRGSCELIIRSCVSAENVGSLPEWAAFLSERWFPGAVCLEPMVESPLALQNGLKPPAPFLFARRWAAARRILEREGIRLVFSSADLSAVRNSICPMGRDALIVDPEGRIGSCWQLSENRRRAAIESGFGAVSGDRLRIDIDLLEDQRRRAEDNRESCRDCFCYANCAGGCMLNRVQGGTFCAVTRSVTLWQLLDRLGCGRLADELLRNEPYLHWLTETENFRSAVPEALDLPVKDPAPDPEEDEGAALADHSGLPLSPAFPDPVRGWLREGSRIITADADKVFVKVLEGDEALRFQLEHSGMSDAEIRIVWDALTGEVS